MVSVLLVTHFNSIKVQLEPSDFVIPELDSIFQFHKGTIRTLAHGSERIYTPISIP